MISQLKNSHDGIRIPSSVFESKLKPALLMLQKGNIKEAFDLIDSAFHDPKLMAAAYFPDEHKFCSIFASLFAFNFANFDGL